jgi:hypothetical protein
MTPEIKEAIEKAAAENNRSMNAEILARLEQSFDPLIAQVRESGDIYGPMERIIERVIRKVREEDKKAGGDGDGGDVVRNG